MFRSSSFDVPRENDANEITISSADDAVLYRYSEDESEWLKVIKLEKCDHTELSALLNFIKNLQTLSPTRILPSDTSEHYKTTACHGVYLPRSIYLEGTELTLSYPICKSGCVFELLKPNFADGGLPEHIVAAIFARAVECVSKLHNRGWIHSALCARHLLLYHAHKSNRTTDELSISLCGLGSIAPVKPLGSPLCRADLPMLDHGWRGWHYQNLLDSVYSTHPVAWYSPEMMAQDFQGYGKSSDIYSLGLTLGELFTGISPFVGTIAPSLIFLKKLSLQGPLDLPQVSFATLLISNHFHEHGFWRLIYA